MERWATFDCYGTLVDWNGGIREQLERLFGVERADELLARFHRIEPEIQAASPGLSYREVLTIALEQLSDETGLTVPEGEASAPARRACARLETLHPLEHRPRPARRLHAGDRRRVRRLDRRR